MLSCITIMSIIKKAIQKKKKSNSHCRKKKKQNGLYQRWKEGERGQTDKGRKTVRSLRVWERRGVASSAL